MRQKRPNKQSLQHTQCSLPGAWSPVKQTGSGWAGSQGIGGKWPVAGRWWSQRGNTEVEKEKREKWTCGRVVMWQYSKDRKQETGMKGRKVSSILCGWERKRRLHFWAGTNHLWCMAGAVITLCYFNNSLIPELSVHYWNANDLPKMRSAAVHMRLYWPFVHTKHAKGIW